jgi:hypothetical protein
MNIDWPAVVLVLAAFFLGLALASLAFLLLS